jgi:hypothetical protein
MNTCRFCTATIANTETPKCYACTYIACVVTGISLIQDQAMYEPVFNQDKEPFVACSTKIPAVLPVQPTMLVDSAGFSAEVR